MSLYLKYVRVHLMSQLSYRKSFILLTIGQFFVPFTIFISMTLLFQRFGTIKDWTLYEVAFCYGIINIAYSTCECIFRGFDTFSSLIRTGGFDRIMLRPRTTVLQVLGSKFEFSRVGRLFQGIIVFCVALPQLNIDWSLTKVLTLMAMLFSGFLIFSGIYILGATMCFFTVEGLEIVNIFTDGGREMAKYPLGIYRETMKIIFTYVIPFGVVNYYPLMFLLGKSDKVLHAISPLIGSLFIIPCLIIWEFGVKRYKSTGS